MKSLKNYSVIEISNNEVFDIVGGAPVGGDKYNFGNVLGCGIAAAENYIRNGWDSVMSLFMNKPGSL